MSSGHPSRENTGHHPIRIGTLLIPTDPYWVQALESIIHASRHTGDELVSMHPVSTMEELHLIDLDDLADQILAQDLDALICTLSYCPLYETLAEAGLPIICLSEINFKHANCATAASLYPSGWLAGEYIGKRLGGKGHAVCVTAGSEPLIINPQSRLVGFQNALKSFPQIETAHIPAYWSYLSAYPRMIEAFRNYPRKIDAIYGISDTIIMAARDAGREVGVVDDSTILVGVNGDAVALSAIIEGTLSATVNTASEKLGAVGLELAHRAAIGQPIPAVIPQEFELITRDNVADFAAQKLVAIASITTRMVGFNRQLEENRIAQLEISTEITRQISLLMERDQIIRVISDLVRKHYGFQWMRVFRWSAEKQELEFYGGSLSPASKQVPIEKDTLLHLVFATHETIFIPDLQKSLRWQVDKEWELIRSRVVVPIQLGEEVIGVLDLQSPEPSRQSTMELVGYKLLGSQVSIAIQNADLYLEARRAQETAERANQLKTRLIANVGHEMRTPLNAILGFSQAVSNKLKDSTLPQPADLEQDVHYIYRSGEHLMHMINDLLDLSRAEIGALNLFFEPVQPTPFLKELFEEFSQADFVPQQVSVKIDVPERLPIIQADTIRLRQILLNLLTNASKFTSQGAITLGAGVEIPHLHIWVQDTGQGVPLELQTKIFEPFHASGRKRRPEGIGLGLSVTRHLVELHDGMITLESQPGYGSTFHVYLPLPGVSERPSRQPQEDSLAILLVMTTQGSRLPEEIDAICGAHNLVPHIVANRDDLLQALEEGLPSAIAWDLTNSPANAWGLIYRLNENKKCAALPVIAYGGNEENGSSTGVTNVVFKPCTGNSLKDWITQVGDSTDDESPILIVDDDPQAREYYSGVVKSVYPNNPLILAKDGLQAMEVLRVEMPSLVLLDLLMPGVDGYTVLERIRRNPKLQHIPVVIISGKLLNYDDIQRLNYTKTVFYNKGIFSDEEMGSLIQQVEDENRPLPQPTSLVIKQGLAFLHQNYVRPISRREIAVAVGVSENYFSQIFRQEMSISPWDYLARLRIQKAKELLQSQDSITHIALKVGFNDPAYFSRVFHKVTGLSPQDYRSNRIT